MVLQAWMYPVLLLAGILLALATDKLGVRYGLRGLLAGFACMIAAILLIMFNLHP
jgi:hypothetical protein